MARHGKKHRDVLVRKPAGEAALADALDFLKANKRAKFDETVDLTVNLAIDPKKSENAVRGTVSLPNGTGKQVRVIVFATGAAADAAKAAGADTVGMADLVEKVQGGWTGFDIAIATTEAMKEVRKLGKVLGPRGLMPNPKTGTVSDDTAAAVRASKGGRVEFRMDRTGSIHVPCGKVSFERDRLAENIEAVLTAIRAEKPAGTKGPFLRSVWVSSTMGVGLKLNIRD